MTQLSEQDAAAIAQLWADYDDAFARGDAAGIAALYAEDGDMIGVDGSHVVGPAAITAAYEGAFTAKYVDVSLRDMELGAPRAVAPGVALVNSTWTVHGLGAEPFRVHSTFLVRKDEQRWRYVAARFAPALQPAG